MLFNAALGLLGSCAAFVKSWEAYLALEVYRSGADQVALVVRLLQRGGSLVPHHDC